MTTCQDSPNIIGRRIRSAIGYRGRTQASVAKALGMSRNSLNRVVLGEVKDPGINLLKSIAQELDVSLAYIAGDSDQINKEP